jgi:DNA-directed RNA polymerase specialized sigma24 family protein
VAQGTGEALWADHLRQQNYLGDAKFVQRMQAQASPATAPTRQPREVPRSQRAAPMTLQECLQEFQPRGEALRVAYRQYGITMTQMAAELGLSVSRISRLIAAAERCLAPGEGR